MLEGQPVEVVALISTRGLDAVMERVGNLRDSLASMPFRRGRDNVTAYNVMDSALRALGAVRDDMARNTPRECTKLMVSLERQSGDVLLVKVDIGTHWVVIPFRMGEVGAVGLESRRYERIVPLESMFSGDGWVPECDVGAERGRIGDLDWGDSRC